MMGSQLNIANVLPHRGQMRLLDELLDYGPEQVVCAVTIRPDSMFCDGVHGVPSWVGIEYMAQTVCAYSGIEEAQRGLKPSIGLLLGVRRYQVEVPLFAIGSRLHVTAELLLRDDNDLVAFDCTIYAGEVRIAGGDVKAIRPKDPHFIRQGRSTIA